ncbi:hypothetical protein D3C87_1703680 [compost metagenome]
MAGGRVVFDGKPSELTTEAVKEIYGSDKDGAGIDETMTSTSINIPAAQAGREQQSGGIGSLASASA